MVILWNTKYEHLISELSIDVDWAVGIELKYNDKHFVVINMHTPYESYANEPEYINRLAHVCSFIEELDMTCVYIVGDLNSDV